MIGWRIGAALLLAAVLAACGGNKTRAGITITASSATIGANAVTIPVNGTEQFAASVSGISSTQVYWQVCLPAATTSIKPTSCTAIPGVTAQGATVLTGYGTINQNGFYTAPAAVPSQNGFLILATSPADSSAFGIFEVIIDSGIRIRVTPTAATIDSGETLQFVATVTGTSNTSVTWEVNGVAGGNAATAGTISAGGLYSVAPGITGSETITALSGADGVSSDSASVTVANAAPVVAALSPTIAAQGSAQQDIYVSGTGFTSNGTVQINSAPPVSIPSCVVQPTAVPCFLFLGAGLLRVPFPAGALQSAGSVLVSFQLQSGPTSTAQTLQVTTVRPSIVAVTPQSVTSSGASPSVDVTGGFFSTVGTATPRTSVQFDGGNEGDVTYGAITGDPNPTRRLAVSLPGSGVLSTPGLYAITAQNPGVSALAAANVAVTPASIPAAPGPNATVSLGGGTQPSAMAIDAAHGVAVVAETGANAVVLINLASPQSAPITVAVGHSPTGVAVDDLLPDPVAVVVNSADNTVSVIDLTVALSGAPVTPQTISLTGFTPITSQPFSVGINAQTHRALVANTSTNVATILNLLPDPSLNAPCNTAPCALLSVGGSLTNFGTGGNPGVAVDPVLNWAVVAPGGAGPIDLIDLGFGNPSPGSGGRAPSVLASLSLTATTRGVGINAETHTALFTDSNSGTVTEFSLLDNSITAVTSTAAPLDVPGEVAAAVNPFQNIGVAVNNEGTGTASIVDMGNHNVLQTVTNLTSQSGAPQAVVIDPASNNALIANTAAGTISLVSLGSAAPKPLQVVEASPSLTYTSTNSLALTVNGLGFAAGSTVLLDGASIGGTVVSAHQVTATIPAVLLASSRRFVVQVRNSDATVSNASSVTVIQPISVGTAPAGIAVDPDRDLAIVTNSGSDNISVVSLAPATVSPQSLGPVGLIATVAAHLDPRGVAVLPRLGLGVVANYESNDVSLVDYSGLFQATPYSLPAVAGCSSNFLCVGPAGVAFNPDTSQLFITDSNIGTTTSDLSFGSVTGATGTVAAAVIVGAVPQVVDQTPGDVAVAPSFDPALPGLTYAAVASAAQTSVIDFVDTSTELVAGRTTGVSEPAGVVYDSLNQQFLVSDALNNDILIVDPLTFVPIFVRGGFNPTSIDYNPQTSTIVAVNGATRTLSLLDYLCPPSANEPGCTAPHVRFSLGLVGSLISTTVPLGPHTVAVDPRLNLAVLLDPNDNRILLIPLP
jgi:DNA-binding beta-propeller fold protein YncE